MTLSASFKTTRTFISLIKVDANNMSHHDYVSENDIDTLIGSREGRRSLGEDMTLQQPPYVTVLDENYPDRSSYNDSTKMLGVPQDNEKK